MAWSIALVIMCIGCAVLIGGVLCVIVILAKVRKALESVEKGR